MNKQEFFAAVKAYKEGKPLQPKVSRDYAIDDWADQYYDQAVALKAKALLAHSCDRSLDEDIYNKQLGILTHMLDGMDESAKILADIESDAKEVLEHGEWKKHKYIRIENGRYIYPEDLEARKKEYDAKYHQVKSEVAASEAHKMHVYNESGKEATKKYNKLLKEKHENAQQAESLKKEASELKDQADKKRFDKSVENLTERNAERKEKEAESVRAKDDSSKNQAQKEGEAMQAWKNQKAIKEAAKKGEGESYEKAKAEGEAQQKWKNEQAVRAKDDNSKNQAQSEGEAYQKWKIKQDAKKGEGESYEKAQREGEAMGKYNSTKNSPYTEAWWHEEVKRLNAISARQDRNFVTITTETAKSPKERIKSGEATADDIRKEIKNKSNEVKNQVYEEAKKYGKDAVVEATELEPDTGAPQRFVIKANNKTVYDTGNFLLEYDEWNYTRAKHSLNLTKEEYYAAIAEYKRKKA